MRTSVRFLAGMMTDLRTGKP